MARSKRRPSGELARLVREQAADASARRCYSERGVVSESDWGGDLNAFTDRRPRMDFRFRLLGSTRPGWSALEHAAAGLEAPDHLASVRLSPSPCPVCQGEPLPTDTLCLACSACGSDGRIEYPGEPVEGGDDEAPPPWFAMVGWPFRAGPLKGGRR